jgi:hypothetical protein
VQKGPRKCKEIVAEDQRMRFEDEEEKREAEVSVKRVRKGQ